MANGQSMRRRTPRQADRCVAPSDVSPAARIAHVTPRDPISESKMLALLLSVMIQIADLQPLQEPVGVIQGAVMNGSQDNQPLKDIDVILRAGADGDLAPVAETKTDENGKFVFEQVPLDSTLVYLPGANRDGVHYPGQRVTLNLDNRVAHVAIVVFDSASTPSPLVVKRHDIDVTVVDKQVLKITESLVVSNPSRATYVGKSMGSGPPVTFWLSIPKNFDRVTFDKEFFGRRFFVVDHRPVTEIPWLPGEQEMRFTYRVPLVESEGQFRRTMDAPSFNVRVRVHGAEERLVTCNLPRLSDAPDGPLVFAAMGEQLARDFTIELQIASLPFPWMQYARWGAVIALAVLVGATVAIPPFRQRLSHSRRRNGRQ